MSGGISPGEFNHQTRYWSAEGDHAMEKDSTAAPDASLLDGADWFDPIEAGVRSEGANSMKQCLRKS